MTFRQSASLSLPLLIIGLIIPYIALGNSLFWIDEAYQALSVRNYQDAPIGMLSFYIGHLWTEIFGDNLYSLRVLMVISYQLSISLSCLFLYRMTGQLFLSSLLFLMLCAAARFVTLPLYGWDAGAYPFMTAFAICLLHFVRRPSFPRIVLLGISSSLMALSRMSTLAALPLILFVIIWVNQKKNNQLGAPPHHHGLDTEAIHCWTSFILPDGCSCDLTHDRRLHGRLYQRMEA